MKSEVYERNVDTQDKWLACILDAAARIKRNVKFNSDKQYAMFAHELQSALKMTVGFSNIYLKL
jgi:hypothetical protein